MHIQTTININRDMLRKMGEVAVLLNISKSKLISLLLCDMLEDKQHEIKLFQRVKYQERAEPEDWHTLHISLSCDLYEKALDLRKLLKMSVSFIVSFAFSKYLKQKASIKLRDDNTDNYISEYIVIVESSHKIESYRVYYYRPDLENLTKKKKNT